MRLTLYPYSSSSVATGDTTIDKEYRWSQDAESMSRSIEFKLFSRRIPEGEYGKKIENFSAAFRRTDTVRSTNIVGSSEASHFGENCLHYDSTWLEENFIVGL